MQKQRLEYWPHPREHPELRLLTGHHARSKVRDTHVYYTAQNLLAKKTEVWETERIPQTMRRYQKLQQWVQGGSKILDPRWWGDTGAPTCFGVILALCLVDISPAETSELGTLASIIGALKMEGNFSKIWVQQSCFKSGERINTKGNDSKGVSVCVSVCACVYMQKERVHTHMWVFKEKIKVSCDERCVPVSLPTADILRFCYICRLATDGKYLLTKPTIKWAQWEKTVKSLHKPWSQE